MLVLGRKSGEKIMIGQEIEVSVLDIDVGRVKLGIRAPGRVPIVRAELKRRDGTAADVRAAYDSPQQSRQACRFS